MDIAGSLISGGLGLLGSLAGGFSTNSANKRMAQMYRESLAFNKYQYEDSKRFNSLPNQVALMRQAGINPALALGSGVGSSAASPIGAPSSASQSGMDYSGYLNSALTPFGSQERLNRSQENLNSANSDKAVEEAVGQNIDNQYKASEAIARINNSNADTAVKEQSKKEIEANIEFLNRTLGDRIEQQSWNTELLRGEAHAKLLTATFLPTLQNAQLNNIIAQTALAYSQGKATLQQAHAAIMNARNGAVAIDAQFGDTKEKREQFSNAAYNLLVQQRSESESREWQNSWLPTGENFRFGSDLFGSFSYGSNGMRQRLSEYKDYKSRKHNKTRR